MAKDIINTDISKEEVKLVQDLSNCLCGSPTISNIRRAHLKLLQFHHHDTSNYPEEFEHLACYKFDPENPANSTLTVAASGIFDEENADQFPGVFVGVSSLKLKKEVMGNDAGATFDNAGEHLSKIATLVLGIKHVAQTEAQVLELCELNLTMLMAQSPHLRPKLGLMSHEVLGYEEPKKIEKAPNRYFEATINIEMKFTWSVTAFQESHRLKKIAVHITPVIHQQNFQ